MGTLKEYSQLEQSLQEAAERHEFKFDPADWEVMEQMLDKKKRRRPILFWLLGAGSICFLCVIGMLIGKKQLSNDSQRSAATELSTGVFGQDAVAAGLRTELDSESVIELENETELPLSAGNINSESSVSDYDGSERSDVIESHSIKSSINSTVASGNRLRTTKNHLISPFTRRNEVIKAHSASSISSQYPLLSLNKIEDTNSIDQQSANSTIKSISEPIGREGDIDQANIKKGVSRIGGVNKLQTITQKLSFSVNKPELISEPVNDHNPGFSKFLFGALAGIETSKTPQGALSQPDFTVGLKFGYFLTSKLGVTIGASYIKDIYCAEHGEYKSSSPDFWKARGAPDLTMANCDMLDVSLGISYHFKNVESQGLVTHINMNSNFMLNEQYMYLYDEPSKDWSASWQNDFNTFLSSVDLSLGYKFASRRSLLFEAGPYAKIPVNGIGHGGIKLTSYGIRIGVSLVK